MGISYILVRDATQTPGISRNNKLTQPWRVSVKRRRPRCRVSTHRNYDFDLGS